MVNFFLAKVGTHGRTKLQYCGLKLCQGHFRTFLHMKKRTAQNTNLDIFRLTSEIRDIKKKMNRTAFIDDNYEK